MNRYTATDYQKWDISTNALNIVKFYPGMGTIDYSALMTLKDSNEKITGTSTKNVTNKEAYEFLSRIDSGKYLLREVNLCGRIIDGTINVPFSKNVFIYLLQICS